MDAVTDIKARLSIEDVVGEYVELKRSGSNFKGLSPWTNERSASLMVSPAKQIWHDFSSGKGGDMFSFVMEADGLDFPAALELLARKAGVDLSQYQKGDGTGAKKKERLYEALELATRYYQATLVKNKQAIEYLVTKRGYGKETVQAFGLGYSPQSESALTSFLLKHKFSVTEIKSAGLGVQRRVFGDMFRGRIMVPLADAQGRTVGFTARILQDDPHAPKYINTPQTLLYDKSRHVYGLHLAKDAIRQLGYAVLVEGNLDVIGSHQAGVKQVVATAGTALTEYHLKAISRFTQDIRLCFDQDRAGLAAAERAIPVAQKVGINLSIINIPDGKDPDELAKKNPEAWRSCIEQPMYAVDWLIDRYAKQLDISTAPGKKEFTSVLLETIQRLGDPVEQDHYVQKIADLTGISKTALQAKRRNLHVAAKPVKKTAVVTDAATSTRFIYQDSLIGLWLLYPMTRRVLDMESYELVLEGAVRQKIYSYLSSHMHDSFDPIPSDLQDDEDYVKMVLLRAETLYGDIDASERLKKAQELVKKTKTDSQKDQTNALTDAIRAAEARGDGEEVRRLLDKFNEVLKRDAKR